MNYGEPYGNMRGKWKRGERGKRGGDWDIVNNMDEKQFQIDGKI